MAHEAPTDDTHAPSQSGDARMQENDETETYIDCDTCNRTHHEALPCSPRITIPLSAAPDSATPN